MAPLHILSQDFLLLPEKSIFWKNESTLLIADAHLGKVSHFRKAGIAVPQKAAVQNLKQIEFLIQRHRPQRVTFLGDLFHSEMNAEWLSFKNLLKKYRETEFELVQGNHDIFHDISYENSHFILEKNAVARGPFWLSHEPAEHESLYNLCGHIHPGVRLFGGGKQSLRMPCFWFGKKGGILPAFGEFTGLFLLKPKKEDSVFVVAENQVIKAA